MAKLGTMKLTVKGRNIDVTPALKEYAEKRVMTLNRFFKWREDVVVEVMMTVIKDNHRAEITYRLGGLVMRGESTQKDMYAAIDEASNRIERRVRRHKNRLASRMHDSPRFAEVPAAAPVEEDDGEAKVVRTKRFAMKPMTVDEALMQLELLGHDFFVYADADTEQINVLYKRRDGQYGLIEPHMER